MTDANVEDESSLQGTLKARDCFMAQARMLEAMETSLKEHGPWTFAELPEYGEAISQLNAAADDCQEAIDNYIQCRDREREVA